MLLVVERQDWNEKRCRIVAHIHDGFQPCMIKAATSKSYISQLMLPALSRIVSSAANTLSYYLLYTIHRLNTILCSIRLKLKFGCIAKVPYQTHEAVLHLFSCCCYCRPCYDDILTAPLPRAKCPVCLPLLLGIGSNGPNPLKGPCPGTLSSRKLQICRSFFSAVLLSTV